MIRITADQKSSDWCAQLKERTAILDSRGKLLGYFTPRRVVEAQVSKTGFARFDEETERLRRANGQA